MNSVPFNWLVRSLFQLSIDALISVKIDSTALSTKLDSFFGFTTLLNSLDFAGIDNKILLISSRRSSIS